MLKSYWIGIVLAIGIAIGMALHALLFGGAGSPQPEASAGQGAAPAPAPPPVAAAPPAAAPARAPAQTAPDARGTRPDRITFNLPANDPRPAYEQQSASENAPQPAPRDSM